MQCTHIIDTISFHVSCNTTPKIYSRFVNYFWKNISAVYFFFSSLYVCFIDVLNIIKRNLYFMLLGTHSFKFFLIFVDAQCIELDTVRTEGRYRLGGCIKIYWDFFYLTIDLSRIICSRYLTFVVIKSRAKWSKKQLYSKKFTIQEDFIHFSSRQSFVSFQLFSIEPQAFERPQLRYRLPCQWLVSPPLLLGYRTRTQERC